MFQQVSHYIESYGVKPLGVSLAISKFFAYFIERRLFTSGCKVAFGKHSSRIRVNLHNPFD